MSNLTRRDLLGAGAGLAAAAWSGPVLADAPAPFDIDEVVDSGHRFFGALSRGFAEAVQEAVRRWGLPNGYILGRKPPRRSWAAFATAKARCTPATPATKKSIGKALRSVSTREPTATGR